MVRSLTNCYQIIYISPYVVISTPSEYFHFDGPNYDFQPLPTIDVYVDSQQDKSSIFVCWQLGVIYSTDFVRTPAISSDLPNVFHRFRILISDLPYQDKRVIESCRFPRNISSLL